VKILGEANNQALAKNRTVRQVLLRGDPKNFLMPSSKNFLIKFFILSVLPITSIPGPTINNYELIKITSQ
jgi:hypothetical protein